MVNLSSRKGSPESRTASREMPSPLWHISQERAATDLSLTQAGSGGPHGGLRGRSGAGGSPTPLMPESTTLTSQQHDQMAEGSQTEQPRER